MVDIVLSAALATLTIVMAYLGVHVTLHPKDELPTEQFWYKVGFLVCGVLAVSLVVAQGVRGFRTQRNAANQIATLQTDVKAAKEDSASAKAEAQGAKTEAEGARQDLKNESGRRQQAEKDLLIALQASGKATRQGVAEDIRKAPIKVEVNGQTSRTPEQQARRKVIRQLLSNDLASANADFSLLYNKEISDDDTLKQIQAWADLTEKHLRDNLGEDYVVRFRSAAGLPTMVPSHAPVSTVKSNLWWLIYYRSARLEQFLEELKD